MTETNTPESPPIDAPDQEAEEANALTSIERAVDAGDKESLRGVLDNFSDADARHVFFELNATRRAGLLSALDPDWAAQLLEPLPTAEKGFLLAGIDPKAAADILTEFDYSDAVEILEELDEDFAAELRSHLDAETERDLAAVENYEEDSAGWLMNPSPIQFQAEQTVGEVLRIIVDDEAALDSAEGQHPYVVSKQGHLLGVLSLRSLLLAKRATPLSSVFIEATALQPEARLEQLKDFFDEHDYLGAPVVGETGVLLGAVSKETVMDAWRGRLRENALKARGIVGDELRSMPLLFRSRRRLAWLSANIGLNVIAAGVIATFEDTLSQVIALAIFLPMVSDMSGCSGNQAVAVSMREISLGLARPSDLLKVWTKEVSVGVINGAILGVIIGLVAWVWMGNPVLGAVIGAALALNTILAVSIGGCIPLILKRFNIDPAVASGPLLTTITDMAGFFLVLSLATLFLHRLI